ncbi:acetylglutamate kinase [Candidatus Magnetoovum chiemensis]|nr:acetylglutamate kinase [Candidatus Magnetoovum chiemensis]
MDKLLEKAEILIEALPYIRTFYKKTFVIKYGGAAQVHTELKDTFARNVVLFNYIGINTVIVHGGGIEISNMMEKMGKEPFFVDGQRVTDKETVNIVEMVLGGLINKEIVSVINRNGGSAVGLCGKDANLIFAKKKLIKKFSANTGADEIIDIGLVGEVTKINPAILSVLKEQGFIPVIAPIGVNEQGETLNINADYAASAIAGALKAEKLILLTDVKGIADKDGNILSSVGKSEIAKHIKENVIKGGMLPKVEACLSALDNGVRKTHIIDGRVPNCLLLEIFTQTGIGSEIVLDE